MEIAWDAGEQLVAIAIMYLGACTIVYIYDRRATSVAAVHEFNLVAAVYIATICQRFPDHDQSNMRIGEEGNYLTERVSMWI